MTVNNFSSISSFFILFCANQVNKIDQIFLKFWCCFLNHFFKKYNIDLKAILFGIWPIIQCFSLLEKTSFNRTSHGPLPLFIELAITISVTMTFTFTITFLGTDKNVTVKVMVSNTRYQYFHDALSAQQFFVRWWESFAYFKKCSMWQSHFRHQIFVKNVAFTVKAVGMMFKSVGSVSKSLIIWSHKQCNCVSSSST